MCRGQDLVGGPGAGGVSILLPLQGQASDPQWELSPALHRSLSNIPTDLVISELILSGGPCFRGPPFIGSSSEVTHYVLSCLWLQLGRSPGPGRIWRTPALLPLLGFVGPGL